MTRSSGQVRRSEKRAAGRTGLLLFALALAIRILFWQAAPDDGCGYSAFYKGDVPVWLAYAAALQEDRPFAADLPFRPPGNAYLLAALWDGTERGLAALRFVWCGLGALTVYLFYLAILRAFGLRVVGA